MEITKSPRHDDIFSWRGLFFFSLFISFSGGGEAILSIYHNPY
ncbi:hypothetical protein [Prevotella aurantiaca]